MQTIQLDQLKPGIESTSVVSILNTFSSGANAAIELARLYESKSGLASFITVTIREVDEEPAILYGPHSLASLYETGYTTLTQIDAEQTQSFELQFAVAKNIPAEHQKQKLNFDLNIGTEHMQTATPTSALQLSPRVIAIDTVDLPPNILGHTTTQSPTPSTIHTEFPHTTLILAFLLGTLSFALIYIFIRLLARRFLRHPR